MEFKTYKDNLKSIQIERKVERMQLIYDVDHKYLDRLFAYGGYKRIMNPISAKKKNRFRSLLQFDRECLEHLDEIGDITQFKRLNKRQKAMDKLSWGYDDFAREAMSDKAFVKYKSGDLNDEDVLAGLAWANSEYARSRGINVSGDRNQRRSSRVGNNVRTTFFR